MQNRDIRSQGQAYTRTVPNTRGAGRVRDRELSMDIVVGIISAILTLVAIGLVVALATYMFPIIFSIGTLLDKKIHNQ